MFLLSEDCCPHYLNVQMIAGNTFKLKQIPMQSGKADKYSRDSVLHTLLLISDVKAFVDDILYILKALFM